MYEEGASTAISSSRDGFVVPGGSWETPNAVFLRITYRSGFSPDTSSRNRGFRCVKSKEAIVTGSKGLICL